MCGRGGLVNGHFTVIYPQQRGFSYDTQFQFPCKFPLSPPTTNRSQWPTNGGALSFIPIHAFGLTTINIALGSNIDEKILSNPYNVPMVPLFNQTGANSTFCLPKIKIPKKIAGDVDDGINATIQVIQLTGTGAALYSCIDITFSDKEADRFGAPAVWDKYCVNGTGMGGYRLGDKDPSRSNATAVQSAASSPARFAGSTATSSLTLPLLTVMWFYVLGFSDMI
ncbi:hypothetical protein C7212DRAFT_201800 [Tuber magnatum]|uniref:Copper acquisition factor BIM1-like domain-containing protein n=1 Tax=Tuber magnatum TaxID=42249 RepID=A0A317SMN4_9PEZI|nr:hypothetical protein C7212DRAFT_201800 [Tuber magnatum]